ncbi:MULTISPECIES: ATP-dependent helicase HrpB [unclassified Crossiella]|uniref:ATP-dependent helicase HrpB n=1 Tax=unclassified Crossiella TaxID=2620835 RepID=UPI001FFEFCED|nr:MULTISPECIES: ATP-dependent helicase HrpB [unclassified Crossiella]MCK2237391.1 ATP-dependent helicase HrpB [Crossiella sp. S99.2]MCK2251046.1 ATP-dependent helicase HrpB [Crossiella sp. S99.1]
MELPDLPVRPALPEIVRTLTAHGAAVLVAPPGTGKTTLVPLALAEGGARVVVAEPRRLAARAAAARMAQLLGEPVGETVGYAVRGDRKRSARTRIEVVTSGLLVRRLQNDPELSTVDIVVLDECHERHLDADLLLALLLDARAGLREDLRLLATSATVAAEQVAGLLGDAPVIRVDARTFPTQTRYLPPVRGQRIEQAVAQAVRVALAEGDGDVLAFLPGVGEINRVAAALAGLDADVLPLHGRLSSAAQDAALRPGPRRRVVLATAVAESSLTVPGVRAVVDAGLARVSTVDHRRGMSGLVTTRVSAAVAEQRAGRAGREAPGRVYRCWPEHEQSALPRYPEPEIRLADLTRLALELAVWGTPDGSALSWWDQPPAGALAAGRTVLHALGALDAEGELTARGRELAELGTHPRFARALVDGSRRVGSRRAAEVVAVLDDDTLAASADLTASLRRLRNERGPAGSRWRREADRLARSLPDTPGGKDDPALIAALAYPERLARKRSGQTGVYLMAGGTAVELRGDGDGLGEAEWLAVAVADREPGRTHGRIRLAAVADEALAVSAGASLLSTVDEIGWADGDVVARRVRRLGAITLSDKPLRDPDRAAVQAALTEGLRKEGLGLLRWTPDSRGLRQRLAFLHQVFGEQWPAMDEDTLLAGLDSWLGPELTTARRRADLAKVDAGHALRRLLPWPVAGRLDELAPERIALPSGNRARLDYGEATPVLPVKVQQAFGWTSTPRIADGRVPVLLHLLSPAGRPAAVTSDLESFWRNGYPQVRAELRGRYPKHKWPEDPFNP